MQPGPMRLADIAARCGGEVLGDPDVLVGAVATLRGAQPGTIAFLAQSRHRAELSLTRASAVIVGEPDREATAIPRIVCPDPYGCFARVATLLDPTPPAAAGIHPTAVVSPSAEVAPDATIGAGCVVGEGVRIGPQSHLHPRVTVYRGCIVGARTTIHAGAVIGADGFGYANEQGRWLKIPQTGRVVVGDDVEIGANTTIDRGAIEDTVIEDGVKLDNQIQIGHNCRIGAHTAIAGCVGIAGSTTVGRHCMIGGAAMIGGHLTIADRVILAGGSTVTKSIERAGTYVGVIPAEEAREWRHMVARLRGLERLAARVRALERGARRREEEE